VRLTTRAGHWVNGPAPPGRAPDQGPRPPVPRLSCRLRAAAPPRGTRYLLADRL